MAYVDPTVASVLDKDPPGDDSDDDALFESFENDPSIQSFREQRLQQLHDEMARAKHLRKQEHGTYAEIKEEKTLMDTVNTGAELCVVHFFKPDFGRCGIMDGHLEKLAPVHFDTRFLRINVENAPFLVTKLNVRVLPCVFAFKNGVSVERITGFEGLGYSEDTFTTKDLEQRLLKAGVLTREKLMASKGFELGKQKETRDRENQNADLDEEDWD
ncbi:MAG: hypothetical protein Q9190_001491 [Brigantiaea leucoxantha]